MSRHQLVILVPLSGAVLVTVLAILGANLGFFGEDSRNSTLATWGLAAVLAEVIGLYVFLAKVIFSNEPKRPLSLLLGPPESPRGFDITLIEWVDEECVLRMGNGKSVPIRLVPSRVGPSFRVQVSEVVIRELKDDDYIELEMKDRKGNLWRVKRFFPSENLVPLITDSTPEKINEDYAEEIE